VFLSSLFCNWTFNSLILILSSMIQGGRKYTVANQLEITLLLFWAQEERLLPAAKNNNSIL
jgi:hypothetical protein